jgi:hypothetical protein
MALAMKIKAKDLVEFLNDVDPDIVVEIGYEHYSGREDGTDIGCPTIIDAELLALTLEKSGKREYTRFVIWATNYPEINGKILKSTRT